MSYEEAVEVFFVSNAQGRSPFDEARDGLSDFDRDDLDEGRPPHGDVTA
jgi:hypothetical protein